MASVKISPPPSAEDSEFAEAMIDEGSPVEPVSMDYDGKVNEGDAQDEIDRLSKFLSATDRMDNPDTEEVYIASLDTNVVIRELSDREADDAYMMFRDIMSGAAMTRTQRRAAGVKDKGLVRTSAQVVAIGLVSPDIKNPTTFAKFKQKFGDDLTVTDLLLKLIKPGEILSLSDRILELTGSGEDVVEEAKN